MLCKVIAHEYRDEVSKIAMEGQDLTHLKDLPQLFCNYFSRYPSSFSSGTSPYIYFYAFFTLGLYSTACFSC